jgi:hypothetical protein
MCSEAKLYSNILFILFFHPQCYNSITNFRENGIRLFLLRVLIFLLINNFKKVLQFIEELDRMEAGTSVCF